jgi:hypothetical protein
VLSYARELDGERLAVALNFRGEPARTGLGSTVELSTDPARRPGEAPGELGPHEGVVVAMSAGDTFGP